jgi:hypothetical protein
LTQGVLTVQVLTVVRIRGVQAGEGCARRAHEYGGGTTPRCATSCRRRMGLRARATRAQQPWIRSQVHRLRSAAWVNRLGGGSPPEGGQRSSLRCFIA